MTGLFIDVSNLYLCAGKDFGGKIEYKSYLADLGELAVKRAYGVRIKNEASSFIRKLSSLGFVTKFVQVPKYTCSSLGVNICIDVIKSLDKLSHVIIGSSSKELIPLIQFLQENDIHVTVFASGIPNEVKNLVDKTINVERKHCEIDNG